MQGQKDEHHSPPSVHKRTCKSAVGTPPPKEESREVETPAAVNEVETATDLDISASEVETPSFPEGTILCHNPDDSDEVFDSALGISACNSGLMAEEDHNDCDDSVKEIASYDVPGLSFTPVDLACVKEKCLQWDMKCQPSCLPEYLCHSAPCKGYPVRTANVHGDRYCFF